MTKILHSILLFFGWAIAYSQLLPIQKVDQWGFINHEGEIMISPKYSWVSSFEGKWCIVKENDQYGILQDNGQIIIKPTYANISFYSEGMVLLQDSLNNIKLYNRCCLCNTHIQELSQGRRVR